MALFRRKKEEEVKLEEPRTKVAEEKVDKQPAVAIPKGEDAGAYQVILNSHITEKASLLNNENKYVFRVRKYANKIQIKDAIEKLYKVEVKQVAVLTMPAKYRRVGRFEGMKSGFKKAIVTLKAGNRIDVVA